MDGSWLDRLQEMQACIKLRPQEAEALLGRACLEHPQECRRCGSGRLYRLARERYRCAACRYTFRLFTGRWFSLLHIPARQWLILLKAFEHGLQGVDVLKLTGLHPQTAYNALNVVRLSLAFQDLAWEPVLRGFLRGDRPIAPLFGLRPSPEGLRVEPIHDALLLAAIRRAPPAMLHLDGFVFAGAHGAFDALVCHRAEAGIWQPRSAQSSGRPQAMGERSGDMDGRDRNADRPRNSFLAFLSSQMPRYHGIGREVFPLYLKEWELRFNRRRALPFRQLLDALARYRPRWARFPARGETRRSAGKR